MQNTREATVIWSTTTGSAQESSRSNAIRGFGAVGQIIGVKVPCGGSRPAAGHLRVRRQPVTQLLSPRDTDRKVPESPAAPSTTVTVQSPSATPVRVADSTESGPSCP